jgi:hypothetical protein
VTWGGRTATTPAEARETLRLRAECEAPSWIESELLGASRRARRRYDERQATERAERQARADELLVLAELPDADLEWLLSVGWQP